LTLQQKRPELGRLVQGATENFPDYSSTVINTSAAGFYSIELNGKCHLIELPCGRTWKGVFVCRSSQSFMPEIS
jgi:hypothetical protein